MAESDRPAQADYRLVQLFVAENCDVTDLWLQKRRMGSLIKLPPTTGSRALSNAQGSRSAAECALI